MHVCAQLWVLAANLEVRAKRVDAARRILGMAVGMAPKDKTFKSYIDMELALGHVDRCVWLLVGLGVEVYTCVNVSYA